MKNVIRLLTLTAIVATVALPILAQDTQQPAAAAAGAQVDEKAKAALYEKFLAERKGDPAAQKRAFELGKEYLQKYGTPEDEIVAFVKKWVGSYELATRDFQYTTSLKEKKYADAFRLGKDILAARPERTAVMVELGWTGYVATTEKNNAHNAEAANLARQAVQLIESGKQPMGLDAQGKALAPSWAPFNTREDALGGLYFALGSFALTEKKAEEAADYFYKAAQQNGFTKKEPSTYANLASAIAASADYKNGIQNYQTEATKDAGSPAAKALLEKLDPMTDRII
ncbi:MAG: hypothetical protein ACRD68_06705, partial [Pyrinomonadaceae bacterium]